MKKMLRAFTALVLCAALLSGCALPGLAGDSLSDPARDAPSLKEPVPFSQMPYVRPDIEALRTKADEIEAALDSGMRYAKLIDLLDAFFAMLSEADTMGTIADIRNSQDLTDAYYAEEYSICLAMDTELDRLQERVLLACGSSPLAGKLAEDYFGEGFLDEYGPGAESTYTDAYLAMAEEEAALIREYRALTAEPSIELDGREWLLSDYLSQVGSGDTYRAYVAYFDKYNPLLGELYLRMLSLRKRMAEELGYDSYAALSYDLVYERDYSVEEGEAFLDSVRRDLVPIYKKSNRMGYGSVYCHQTVGEAELLRALEAVADGLGGDAADTLAFLRRYELYDLRASEQKIDVSFMTYLQDYDAPFLFVNPDGDITDYNSVTHEFGHCVQGYVAHGLDCSIDLAECFSQGMQFLSLDPLRAVLDADTVENLRRINLSEVLQTYAAQCAYAAFETEAFACEDPSVEKLNAIFRRCCIDFGIYDGSEDALLDLVWVDVNHFFESPFYVIAYATSQGVAAEIYAQELAEPGAGLSLFYRLMDAESGGIVGAAQEAGLSSPLSEDFILHMANFMKAQLGMSEHALSQFLGGMTSSQ